MISFLIHAGVNAQAIKKQVNAINIDNPPEIDGILNDPAWENAPVAENFLQISPYNGKPASLNSAVKFVYDQEAIYVGGMLYDQHPDSIMTELSKRDQIKQSDYMGVYLDPFNDGATAYGFFVTAAGVQVDIKSTDSNGEDVSWDAVWFSEFRINDQGWVVELKIPYSALRIPEKEVQVWGLQILRNIKRYRENTSWNLIDNKEAGLNNQAGQLNGIKNINPPLRLSFYPYVSGYAEKFTNEKSWAFTYNYGMDVKYGINESFTLDMTLVPDFGQVESDEKIYNLSPFETYYSEKRPFFTEGTELFDRGGVFYSRRIGDEPTRYDAVEDSLGENEEIVDNPRETQLINATKISGKTKGGLGVGFFNAMTARTFATVKNTETGEKREVMTEPFTNYNMVVLDQSLQNNGYASFFNTNVFQGKWGYSANVTGSDVRLVNKRNRYAFRAMGILSQKYDDELEPNFGHRNYFNFGKISGNFKYTLWQNTESDNYDPNDMGFLSSNNEFAYGAIVRYNIYDPFWKVLSWYNSLYLDWEHLYEPRKFSSFDIEFRSRTTLKNHLSIGLNTEISPVEEHDFYEPRVDGRVLIRPPSYTTYFWLSPDYRKTFVVDFNAGYWWATRYDQYSYWLGIEPRLRLSDRLMIIHEFKYDIEDNDIGYVSILQNDNAQDTIIIGKRRLTNFTNTLNLDYIFTNKASLSFRLRHYWLKGEYDQFYALQEDGYLGNTNYSQNNNFNFNAFTIDLGFYWNFAPGSEISVVWKNAINRTGDQAVDHFFDNFQKTLEQPATNSFSLKMLYYIDYQYLKKKI